MVYGLLSRPPSSGAPPPPGGATAAAAATPLVDDPIPSDFFPGQMVFDIEADTAFGRVGILQKQKDPAPNETWELAYDVEFDDVGRPDIDYGSRERAFASKSAFIPLP